MIRPIPILAVIAVLLWQPTEGWTAPSSDQFGSYHALVIGNDKYEHLPKLNNAVEDAKDVSFVLKRMYGFKVQTLLNASRADIFEALTQLRSELNWDSNLVVYYAGHGFLDDITEEGYWLPVDAAENNPANWVSNSTITNMLKAIQAKHIIVVADSCYSGTLVRTAPAKLHTAKERDIWWERMSQKRSRTAMVSGGLEPVLDGGGGKNSVFASALMSVLKDNQTIMDGNAVYQALKRNVALGSPQTPQYSDIRQAGHGGGDFLFVRRGGVKAETTTSEAPKEITATSTQPSEKADMLFWQSIKGSTDSNDYDDYLEQFPSGIFASLARRKIENLSKPKQVAKLTPDKELKPERQEPVASDIQRSLRLDIEFPSKPKLNIRNLIVPIEEDGEFSITHKKGSFSIYTSGLVHRSKFRVKGYFYTGETSGSSWEAKMVKYDFSAKGVLHKGPKPTQMRAKIDFFDTQMPSPPDMKISAQIVDVPSTAQGLKSLHHDIEVPGNKKHGSLSSLKHGLRIISSRTGEYQSKDMIVNVDKNGEFKIDYEDYLIMYSVVGEISNGKIKANGGFYLSGLHNFWSKFNHSFSINERFNHSYFKHSFISHNDYAETIPVTMFFKLVDAPRTGTTAASK